MPENNKVIYNNQTILDLTGDTVTAANLLVGILAHSAAGEQITGQYVPLDTSDANATADDILSGKSGYVNGVKVNGNISSQAGGNIYATTSDQTIITAPKYIDSNLVLKGITQSGLVSTNILRGQTITINNGNSNIFSVNGNASILKRETTSGILTGTKEITSGSDKIPFKRVSIDLNPVYAFSIVGSGSIGTAGFGIRTKSSDLYACFNNKLYKYASNVTGWSWTKGEIDIPCSNGSISNTFVVIGYP